MASKFLLDNHVHMQTTTAGTTNAYIVQGLSGFRDFADYLGLAGDNDTTWITCYDDGDPVKYEASLATYSTTTGRLTRSVFQSSDGTNPINWPGTGTRDIVCGLPAAVLEGMTADPADHYGILNPEMPKGFATKVSPTSGDRPIFASREMTSDGSGITITNGTGESGDPSFALDYDITTLARKDAAQTISSDWTHTGEVILDATTTAITNDTWATDTHVVRDSAATSKELFEIVRDAEQSASVWMYEGGAGTTKKVLTQGNYTDEPLPIIHEYAESTASARSTVRSDTEITITIPAGISDYTITVDWAITAQYGDGNDNKSFSAWLEMSTGTYSAVSYAYAGGDGTVFVNYRNTVSGLYAVDPATADTVYQFRLDGVGTSNYNLGGDATVAMHHVRALAFRKGA